MPLTLSINVLVRWLLALVTGTAVDRFIHVLLVADSAPFVVRLITGYRVRWTARPYERKGFASSSTHSAGRAGASIEGVATKTGRRRFAMLVRAVTAVTVVVLVLAACSGETALPKPTEPPPPTTGTIAGSIGVGQASSMARIAHEPSEIAEIPRLTFPEAPFRPGEIIVAFEPGLAAQSAARLSVAGVALDVIDVVPGLGAQLLGNPAVGAADTLRLVRELQR